MVETTNLHFEDFSKICRLCLAHRQLQPIRTTKIVMLIISVTNLEVRSDDKLPEHICKKCIRHLEDISLFINICKSNVETLKSVIPKESDSGIKIKVEIPDNNDCPIISECSDIKEIDIAGIKSENDQLFLCDICEKKFSCKNKLDQHMLHHPKPKRFFCEECGEGFHKSELKRHLMTHTKVEAVKCEICGLYIPESIYLTDHYKRRKGETAHKCSYGRAFSEDVKNS